MQPTLASGAEVGARAGTKAAAAARAKTPLEANPCPERVRRSIPVPPVSARHMPTVPEPHCNRPHRAHATFLAAVFEPHCIVTLLSWKQATRARRKGEPSWKRPAGEEGAAGVTARRTLRGPRGGVAASRCARVERARSRANRSNSPLLKSDRLGRGFCGVWQCASCFECSGDIGKTGSCVSVRWRSAWTRPLRGRGRFSRSVCTRLKKILRRSYGMSSSRTIYGPARLMCCRVHSRGLCEPSECEVASASRNTTFRTTAGV